MDMSVDELFGSRTIKDIVELERKLRNEVEYKREEVRMMVGARYRELIEAADTILDMKTGIYAYKYTRICIYTCNTRIYMHTCMHAYT